MANGVWTFWAYATNGGDVVRDWYSVATPEVQAAFDNRIRILRVRPPGTWRRPWVDSMHGYPGLIEIRFEADGVQWRPLGFYGPERLQFTITLVAEERGKKIPSTDCKRALRRWDQIRNGETGIIQYEPPEQTL